MLEFLEEHPEVPGATIAIARMKVNSFIAAASMSLPRDKMAMKPNAKLRIASISKPITATAILLLIERGKLKLNDKVFDVCSTWRNRRKGPNSIGAGAR